MRIDFSRIRTYRRCPRLYELVYIEKKRIPPPGALVLGRNIHLTAEEGLKKKKIGEEVRSEFWLDYFSTVFNRSCEIEEIDWQGETKEEVKKDGEKLIAIYRDEEFPSIEPAEIEFHFTLKFQNYPHELYGKIDLIDCSDWIIDLKTSTRTPKKESIETDGQATCYLLAFRILMKKLAMGFRFGYLIRTKHPFFLPLTTNRTDDEFNQFLRDMALTIEGIQKGIFPRNPDNVFCNKNGCGFYSRVCFPARG